MKTIKITNKLFDKKQQFNTQPSNNQTSSPNSTLSISGSSRERFATSKIPVSSKDPNESPPISHISHFPSRYCSEHLDKKSGSNRNNKRQQQATARRKKATGASNSKKKNAVIDDVEEAAV